MGYPAKTTESTDAPLLNLFCAREGEAWRVYVRPTALPRYLRAYLDRHGEAYPILFDFEDLERHMAAAGMEYDKRVARTGDVEVTARGEAVAVLAEWLSTAFASGVRPRNS